METRARREIARTPAPDPSPLPLTVSEPALLGCVRWLRAITVFLEAGLYAALVWVVLAFGGLPRWGQAGLGIVALALGLGLVARGLLTRRLRERLSPSPIVLHPSGRWLTLWPDERSPGGRIDLGDPVGPRGPLLRPGLVFAAWVGLQLLPFGGGPVSIAPGKTLSGLLLLLCALVLHAVGTAVWRDAAAARRRVAGLAHFGLVLSLGALYLFATNERRHWELFPPPPGGNPFGPFWYRNHYAVLVAMLIPAALSLLSRAAIDAWHAQGRRPRQRPRAASLLAPEALALVEWSLPPLALVASLVATTSRGGLLALVGGLAAGALIAPRSPRRRAFPLLTAAGFLGMALFLFGPERVTDRFAQATTYAPGRDLGWSAAATLARERPGLGWGFNTYPEAVERHSEMARALRAVDVHLVMGAHNDYLQLAAETGLPGLALVLWAAGATLIGARLEPWRFAALTAGLLHAGLDFDIQVPAVLVLFALLAAPSAPRYGTLPP